MSGETRSKHAYFIGWGSLLFGVSRLLVARAAAGRQQLTPPELNIDCRPTPADDRALVPIAGEPSTQTPRALVPSAGEPSPLSSSFPEPSPSSHWGQSPGRAVAATDLHRTASWEALRSSYSPLDVLAEKLVVVMVGLPARGKSFLGKAITRHLNW